MKNQVKTLLRIIRYSPFIIILSMSILVITILINEQKIEFEEQKKNIEKQFLQDEKERIKSNIDTIDTYIKLLNNTALNELRNELKNNIDMAYNIMSNIYNKNKNKKTKKEIIEQIKEAIDTIRYKDGNGYFSIHTLKGINLLHPINKNYEGKSVLYRQDTKGTYSVQKAISIAKTKGEGFLNWYSPKPNGGTKELEKIGIVKKFEPYGLIITTGVFKKDFLTQLKKKTLNYISKLKYKNNAYVFVVGFNGDVIYHPTKSTVNGNLFTENRFSHIKDKYKNLLSKKGVDVGTYFSVIPKITEGANTKEIKITYAKKIDVWNWIIATTFKLSEAQHIIKNMKNIQEKKYNKYKSDVIFYGIIFTICFLIISYFISKLLEREFLNYKKNLEKQINRNKTQKETLLEAQKVANIGNWELNLETKKAYWSDEIIRIFGLNKKDKDKFGSEFLKNIMFKEDIHCFENSLKLCQKTGKEHQCIYRIKRSDGERWIECRGRLHENKLSIVGTIQDITKSKTLEMEKKQKDEILFQQSKMAAMGEMLGNIAHQWRQPLSTISAASTGMQIQKEMNVLTDEEIDKSLRVINESAQYLSQIIEDFRGFFNPKNKKTEFDITDTFVKTLKLISAQFNAKDIEIIQDIEPSKLISLENQLIQVLVNILNNARDALLLNEKQKRLLFINVYKKENVLYIEILDNAGGIKKDIINRVFEPYFTTKYKSQGTGIGLYMSEEIIEKHLNGSITVSNESFVYKNINYIGAKFVIKLNIILEKV